MTPDDPRHGTYAGYVAGCRCWPCGIENRRYGKRAAMRRMHQGPLTVDAAKAIAHIDKGIRWGVQYAAYVDAVGVSNAGRIHRGELPRIHRRTEQRILSVLPQPGVNCWSALAGRRRLQALVRMGHPQATLAAELGVVQSYVSMLTNETRHWSNLAPDTWQAISDLYDRLEMIHGGSARALNMAQKRGWAPPMAWDNINDPDEHPKGIGAPKGRLPNDVDPVIVDRLVGLERVQSTRAEKEAAMARWVAAGGSINALCDAHGWQQGRYVARKQSAA